MTAGERFRNWIDATASGWADRLGRWTGTAIGAGIDAFAKILGKAAAPKLKPFIEALEKSGVVPPELQPLLDEMKDPTGETAAIFSQAIGGTIVGGAIGQILDAFLRPLGYWANRFQQNLMPNLAQLMTFWLRGRIKDKDLPFFITSQGFPEGMVEDFKDLSKIRLDETSWIKAFRRGFPKFIDIENDLIDQGWSAERIEALKFVTLFLPTATDIVSWYAREVYEPDMVDRYGLGDELPDYEKTDFPKIGVDSTQAANYWMAHWEHASYMQIREMLHRGLLSLDKTMPAPPTTEAGWATRDAEGEKAAYDWYRLVEIPPFWRARLTEMMYEVPTRVDVRRFWDMRTIDEERLRSIYHAQGYHGKDLDDYILWTKVYTAFPDLMARWSNGWITLDEVKSELTGLGMPADRVDEMIQTKVKAAQPERTTKERDLTKTEIYKGVKKELISWGEGVELLMDLGYDEDEADYILAVNITAAAGSPETYAEFKDLTQKWRKATGMEAKPMTEEIKTAAAEVVKLTGDVEALTRSIVEEKRGLVEEEVLPEAITKRLKGLQVKLHRAEAKLSAAKSEYARLVAEWKHGLP